MPRRGGKEQQEKVTFQRKFPHTGSQFPHHGFDTDRERGRAAEAGGEEKVRSPSPEEVEEMHRRSQEEKEEREKNAQLLIEAHQKLQQANSQIAQMQEEVDRARREGQEAAKSWEGKESELVALRKEVSEFKAQNQGSEGDLAKAREHNATLRKEIVTLREQGDGFKRAKEELTTEIFQLREELNSARGQLKQTAPEVERQVVVEREGMRARADLLRKVYENFKLTATALKATKQGKNTEALNKVRSTARDPSLRGLLVNLETIDQALAAQQANSVMIIKTYFTTNEKLTAGIPADWFKPDAGRPRALEERVTTTTTTTQQRVSPERPPSPKGYPSAGPIHSTSTVITSSSGSPTLGGGRSSPMGHVLYSAHTSAGRASPSPKSTVRGGYSPTVFYNGVTHSK